jgi:hypothetical protein
MDNDASAIGLLALLITLGGCIGVGVVSSSVWEAVGRAVAPVLFLGVILYIVLDLGPIPADGLGQALAIATTLGTLIFLLPAAAIVAAVASIISNGGRLRRTPEDKT